MDIAGAITAVGGALTIAKELRSLDAGLGQAELKQKIVDLTDSLLDAKSALVGMADEIRSRDEEIKRLQEALKQRADSLIEVGFYRYFKNADGNATGAPICPICESKGLFLQVAQRTGGHFTCPHCKADYGTRIRALI